MTDEQSEKKYTNFCSQCRYKLKKRGEEQNATVIYNWQTFRYWLYQTPDITARNRTSGQTETGQQSFHKFSFLDRHPY